MEKLYFTAQECAELLGISLSHSYKLVRMLNRELEQQNYITIAGKVPRAYFRKKYYVGDASEVKKRASV